MRARTRGGRDDGRIRKESCDNAEEEANGCVRVRVDGGVFFTPVRNESIRAGAHAHGRA